MAYKPPKVNHLQYMDQLTNSIDEMMERQVPGLHSSYFEKIVDKSVDDTYKLLGIKRGDFNKNELQQIDKHISAIKSNYKPAAPVTPKSNSTFAGETPEQKEQRLKEARENWSEIEKNRPKQGPVPTKTTNNPVNQSATKPVTPQTAPQQAAATATNAATTGNVDPAKEVKKDIEVQHAQQKAAQVTEHSLPGVEGAAKTTTVGDLMKRGYKSYMNKPLASRRRGGMIAGAIIGGLTSDDWGNSFTGTAIDAGIGAGVGAAVTHAADYIQNHYGKPIGDFLTEGVKVSDIAKGEVERDAVKTVEKMNSVFRGQNKIAMGIAAIIGIGTVASVSNDLHHETKVERMKDDEEKQNTRKENKQKELMSRYYGWNQSIDMGQMAIDMFNDRIGHHLMGNSKFK